MLLWINAGVPQLPSPAGRLLWPTGCGSDRPQGGDHHTLFHTGRLLPSTARVPASTDLQARPRWQVLHMGSDLDFSPKQTTKMTVLEQKQPTFLDRSLCSLIGFWSIWGWHGNMLDDWQNVEDVIWTNWTFVLVIKEVVSQSDLLYTITFWIVSHWFCHFQKKSH